MIPIDTGNSVIESEDCDARPARCEDWISRELDGEAIFYDIATDTTCRLNETALLIWQLCDGSTSVRNIVASLVSEYDVSKSEARADVRETLSQLHSVGLISTDGANA